MSLRPVRRGYPASFPTKDMQEFRRYIDTISRWVDFSGNVIGFLAPRSLPSSHAYGMRTEADIRVFDGPLYIDPVHLIIQEMLPLAHIRNYDLVLLSEIEPLRINPMLPLRVEEEEEEDENSVLDKGRSKRIGSTDQPVVLIKFKAPNLVYNARNSVKSRQDTSQTGRR
ncbi:hypothetical protein BDD12DRAFT_894432 [Trichophaea hybrida]|nr:hypothetical protein BDD12DRAFT_894432 [Trichophaea hybrida]